MSRQTFALLVLLALPMTAASVFASGSVATRPPARQVVQRSNANSGQAAATGNSEKVIADEPYNLGKALFGGKYKFGNSKSTEANVAEKLQRLVSLRRTLPAAERTKIDPSILSKQLTNREMNALEYYLATRFGKFITKEPSWSKTEPRPQIASTR